MKVKLLLFGESVEIPKVAVSMGVGAVTVWMDSSGFTTATNSVGALGYILLETPHVDVGILDSVKQRVFSNLHGQVVTFDISPSLFVRDGGNARVAMTVELQDGGSLTAEKIEFQADDCTGIAVVSNSLHFTATMFQLQAVVADLDNGTILDEGDVVAIADSAPTSGGQASATA